MHLEVLSGSHKVLSGHQKALLSDSSSLPKCMCVSLLYLPSQQFLSPFWSKAISGMQCAHFVTLAGGERAREHKSLSRRARGLSAQPYSLRDRDHLRTKVAESDCFLMEISGFKTDRPGCDFDFFVSLGKFLGSSKHQFSYLHNGTTVQSLL